MNKLLFLTLLFLAITSKRVVHRQDEGDDDDKLEQCIVDHCSGEVLACKKACQDTFAKCVDGLNEHPATQEEDEEEQEQFDQCIVQDKKAQKLAQCIQSNCSEENRKRW